jgi:mRNA-degrading endonuclease toxin of MazEF toxin-antitoxin module
MKPLPTSKPTTYAPGDIVVVPFPCSDRLAEKRRPALVVSNARLAEQGFVWLAMITSARQSALAHDAPIRDLALAGLPAPSVVRPTKVATVEPSRIVRKAGRLGRAETAKALATVRGFVGD